MQITKHRVVSFDYKLTDGQGTVIDSSEGREPLSYLHGTSAIIPGLEAELEGKAAGDNLNVVVEPQDAYGERRDELRAQVPRQQFDSPEALQVGMQFRTQSETGSDQVVTITAIDNDQVTIDGNHPLAGVTLHFDIAIDTVREATAEEIAQGSVIGSKA